ncbi:glycosyltransferase family 4 protein [Phenylobacterium sp.]|uniref:glycosyltransferase family 4 protein n=1 Tax=Phenylobacterium sp. TaxID=1871053 RepID=UPI002F3E78D8
MTAPDLAVVGYPFSPSGMGEHARSVCRALWAAGAAPALVDVAPEGGAFDPDLRRTFAPHLRAGPSPGLNLFCINADEVERVTALLDRGAFEGARNIIYPAWELAVYPQPWARLVERFDEVWAPSAFIRDALVPAVGRPVAHMPLAVELTLSSFLGRRHFAIPEDAFVFLFFFDFSSYAERKNAGAVLEAFERLALARPEARLHCVIKFRGAAGTEAARQALEARLQALGGRVQAINADLSDNEIKNLVRNADVFVSLHRSEGFGRGMAEAMALGRTAIATGYSGNLDFMTPETSLLVDYDLVPVAAGAYPHGDGQVWAEPSVAHAARLMEQALDDPAGMRALGARARRHIRTDFSARAVGLRYVARLEAVARGAPA